MLYISTLLCLFLEFVLSQDKRNWKTEKYYSSTEKLVPQEVCELCDDDKQKKRDIIRLDILMILVAVK